VSVAAGSGYWRDNAPHWKRIVLYFWHVLVPLAVMVAGYFPGYENALRELLRIAPADVGANRIGHFGFFRPQFESTLWRRLETLLEGFGARANPAT
jgi:hypothetical protein